MIRKIFHMLYMLWLHMAAFLQKFAVHKVSFVQFGERRNYVIQQWSQQLAMIRRPALPQGAPVLALPEGRESVLTREIERIEKAANSGCGQYYELYEPRVLRALRSLKDRLSPYDLTIFNRINHWNLSDEAYAASCRAESEVWNEIRAGYDCDDD